MLQVKTKLGSSKIHGIGVFANQNIKKGQVVWKFTSLLDRLIDLNIFEKMPKDMKLFVRTYGWKWKNYWVLSGDNDRFLNYSTKPNVKDRPGLADSIAARDINKGEELTCNYSKFCEDFKINKKMEKI